MPRPSKGPRLYLHPVERVWLIRDGAITRRTGCGESDSEGAEQALGAYISEKFVPATRESDLAKIPVNEVLTAYGREHAPTTKGNTAVTIGYNIAALAPWWADKTLADIRKETCRKYAEYRARKVSMNTARRELSVLGAAVHHWHSEHGPLQAVPVVTLPEKPPARERWLTRSEAALLLAGALGWYREFWSDVKTREVHQRWCRNHFTINRHAARFILLGLYTGTRHGALLGVQWMPNTAGGWIDLDRGVMHRRGERMAETKKRQPPVKLGRKILMHARRWKWIDDRARGEAAEALGEPVALYLHVVTYDGKPLQKLRRSWETAREFAWLDGAVIPHVLRHTRATWMMQQRIDMWEAAGALGMSPKTLIEVYGHHHPDWQKNAAEV